MSIDHGTLNIPLAKRGNIDAQLDAYKREQAKERRAEAAERTKARRAARAAEKARVKFTADQLADAVLVRDDLGWVRVIRVNAKTVTVAGALGEQRISIEAVRDFRNNPSG